MDGLPVFLGKVPDYEVRDGRMHIIVDGFHMVMPLRVFQIGCKRGAEAIAKWQVAELDKPTAKVIKMPRKRH